MKKLLLAINLLANLTWAIPSLAQNTTCSDRPSADSSNACANTRFVQSHAGGGGTPGGSNLQVQYNNAGSFGGLSDQQLTARIQQFNSFLAGDVPLSGGGIVNFLRADGTWAPPGGGSAVVGTILPWAGGIVPPSYLLAYGQAVSRATYSDLKTSITLSANITCASGNPTITVTADVAQRAPIGAKVEVPTCFSAGTTVLSKGATTLTLSTNAIASITATMLVFPWGNGDGSTTFNIPNLQGRSLVGRDNMSGTAAGVLTSTFYGANPDALGAIGGAQSVTLTRAQLPTGITSSGTGSVTVTSTVGNIVLGGDLAVISSGGGGFTWPSVAENSSFGGVTSTGSVTSSVTSNNTGGGAHGIIQPSITIDWIIKALPDSNVSNDTITVGATTVAGGSTTNILYNNAGILGEYSLATANQYNCATAGSVVQPSVVYQAETTTTYGTTTTFDFCTFKNTSVTLTGNITTQTLSNVVAGKAGMITFIQDGTGSRTTVWNSIFKFTGGTTPTLTTTAGAVDILTYACRSATFCGASLLTDVK